MNCLHYCAFFDSPLVCEFLLKQEKLFGREKIRPETKISRKLFSRARFQFWINVVRRRSIKRRCTSPVQVFRTRRFAFWFSSAPTNFSSMIKTERPKVFSFFFFVRNAPVESKPFQIVCRKSRPTIVESRKSIR